MRFMIRRTLLTAILSLVPVASLAAQEGPYSLTDTEVLVRLVPEVGREVVGVIIQEGCVTFPLDASATSRLRSAGADDTLLEIIRETCFTGAELVVQSNRSSSAISGWASPPGRAGIPVGSNSRFRFGPSSRRRTRP
jgi:hypothetical protein